MLAALRLLVGAASCCCAWLLSASQLGCYLDLLSSRLCSCMQPTHEISRAAHASHLPPTFFPTAASSDDEPPSARTHRQRQSAATADDEDEAEAYALLARATGKAPPARPGARGTSSFYGASGASGGGNLERRVSLGQSEEEFRSKVGDQRLSEGRK